MNADVGSGLETQSWRNVYQAAICESDLNKLPRRIDDAEAALAIRARELFNTVGDDHKERESLDDERKLNSESCPPD